MVALDSFEGEFDRTDRGNINPRPQKSIPIWMGGFSEPAFRRGAQMGDGFIFGGSVERTFNSGSTTVMSVLDGWKRVKQHLAEADRSVEGFGADLVMLACRNANDVTDTIQRWRDAGGTHASVVTMGLGFTSVDQHLDYMAEVRTRLDH